MAKIGNLGKLITFSVSSKKVLTFDGLQQTVSGRWAKHDVISKKPVKEFLGPDSRSITLPIYLSAAHGVKPRKTMEKIEKAVEKGTPYKLVIGGKKIGKYKWVIEKMGESWGEIIEDGKLMAVNLNLTLSEYR